MAGVSRLQYRNEIRLIRVMCSGRVDMSFVFRSFYNGMDGVYIGACRLNECNYTTHGNYHALNMVLLSKRIMEHVGIDPQRLRIEFMNASMGQYFAETVNDFTQKVRQMGPIGKGEGLDGESLKERLREVLSLIPYIKMAKRGKLSTRLKDPDSWHGFFTKEEVDTLFKEIPYYYIDPEKCQACMTCFRRCPVEAIQGGKGLVHVIDQERCIKCGTCLEVCPPRFRAVRKMVGEVPPPPLPEEARRIVRKGKEEEGT